MTTPPVYLDDPATTRCDPRVVEAMLPWLAGPPGNPHSRQHAAGRAAAAAIETARARIAALIGARPGEILFTSGATEANNLAILGAVPARRDRNRHVVTLATEHAAVLEPCRRLAGAGIDLTVLPVGPGGLVDLGLIAGALRADTALVSVMAVNNETGVIQPIAEIAALSGRAGALVHCDAAQAAGRLELDVGRLGVDLMSLSAHKLHGPMGVGALYVRAGTRLQPLAVGGGQESGLRPGTLPTALCVGFGVACNLVAEARPVESARIERLARRLWQGLSARLPGIARNGDPEHGVAGILNVTIPGLGGQALIDEIDGIAVASGAACSSADRSPSHVLLALGLDPAAAAASLRLGMGRFTTESDIDTAIGAISAAAFRLGARVAPADDRVASMDRMGRG